MKTQRRCVESWMAKKSMCINPADLAMEGYTGKTNKKSKQAKKKTKKKKPKKQPTQQTKKQSTNQEINKQPKNLEGFLLV